MIFQSHTEQMYSHRWAEHHDLNIMTGHRVRRWSVDEKTSSQRQFSLLVTTAGDDEPNVFTCRVLIFATGLEAQYAQSSVDTSKANELIANLEDIAEHYIDYDDDPSTFMVCSRLLRGLCIFISTNDSAVAQGKRVAIVGRGNSAFEVDLFECGHRFKSACFTNVFFLYARLQIQSRLSHTTQQLSDLTE